MPSFDVVSKTDMQEVDNALSGVGREIGSRFDFKGSKCAVTREEETMTVLADDDLKLRQVHELIKTYFVRRNIDPAALEYKDPEKASGGSVRQKIIVRQGLSQEISKKIVKAIKDSKMKVQAAIQGDELRVSGKNRDDLQAAIALIKGLKIELPLQYVNFRD